MSEAVAPLNQAHIVSKFGGKASNLAKLLQAKVTVPGGLAIGISAFDTNGKLKPASKATIESWLKKQKKTEKYAVRSSAVNEDGHDQSWAGQFDTYLNITANDILNKAEACHGAVGARAKAYGQANAHEADFAVAVVIQKMVKPDYAGVLFTRNPVDNSNQIVIEYMAGLAEQLVSGEVTPESCVWDRETHQLDTNYSPPFNTQDLITTALSIEELYGAPQDIEWAVQDGQFFIVQARPITTLSA